MDREVKTSELVSSAITDVRTLVELEVKLLKAEALNAAETTRRAFFLSSLAVVATLPALFFLGLGLAGALAAATGMTAWQADLLLAGVAAGPVIYCAFKAQRLWRELGLAKR